MKLSLLIFIHLFKFYEISTEIYSCDDWDKAGENYKQYFATKTSYNNAYIDKQFEKQFSHLTEGCEPELVWFFTRHGTRYPLQSDMDEFLVLPLIAEELVFNHFQSRGCLTEEDTFKFKSWTKPYSKLDRGELHVTGAEELFELGKFWKQKLPNLFEAPYHESKVKVQFSISNRTGQSAYHFIRGLYGDDSIGDIKLPKPFSPNYIVRFHKACARWMSEVYKNNETTYRERNLFAATSRFRSMLEGINGRLGYITPLGAKEILAMYDECRYESAWFPDTDSIWCKPFSSTDIEIIEYYQDLKYYYEDSYGTPLNTQTACLAISDLYKKLRTKVSGESDSQRSFLYFSHDKASMQLQAILGLFKPDEHLRHDNIDPNRPFKTSRLGTFASNIAFVLYKCGDVNKVALFFNGHPQPVPKVCDSVVCSWRDYEKFLSEVANNCDFRKLCDIRDEL